jgi:hypothetical protein
MKKLNPAMVETENFTLLVNDFALPTKYMKT